MSSPIVSSWCPLFASGYICWAPVAPMDQFGSLFYPICLCLQTARQKVSSFKSRYEGELMGAIKYLQNGLILHFYTFFLTYGLRVQDVVQCTYCTNMFGPKLNALYGQMIGIRGYFLSLSTNPMEI